MRGTSIAGDKPAANLSSGVMEGIKDTFRHFWLVVRCSAVGVFVGIMPGAGGGVAQWMAYAHAVQSAKNAKEREGLGKETSEGIGTRRCQQLEGGRRPDSDDSVRRAGKRGDGDTSRRLHDHGAGSRA